jgi:hypothetical protein
MLRRARFLICPFRDVSAVHSTSFPADKKRMLLDNQLKVLRTAAVDVPQGTNDMPFLARSTLWEMCTRSSKRLSQATAGNLWRRSNGPWSRIPTVCALYGKLWCFFFTGWQAYLHCMAAVQAHIVFKVFISGIFA